MRLQLEDGTVVEVPDDATDEEITQIANDLGLDQNDGKSDVGAIASGLGSRGPAYMLGSPVDLMSLGLELGGQAMQPMIEGLSGVPIDDLYNNPEPVMGSEWIMNRMEDVGIPARTEAATGTGRVLSRIAEELGAAGTGGIAGATGRLGAIGRAMSEAPVTQMAASGAAGLGAGLANEVAPGSQLAELAGALAGGLPVAAAGSVLNRVGAQARQFGQRAIDLFGPEGRQRLADTAVQRQMTNPDQVSGNIDQALQQRFLPGSEPIGADLAMDPGVSALTRTMSQNQQSPMLGQYTDRMAANDQARRDALATVGGQTTPEAAGGVIAQEFGVGHDAMREATRNAYQSVTAGGVPQIPVRPQSRAANQIMAEFFGPGAGAPPNGLSEIVVMLGSAEALPFDQLQRMRSRAGELGNQARSGATPDRRVAAVADQLVRQIDAAVEAAVNSGAMPPAAADAWRSAQQMRTTQGDLYERGPVGALSQTRNGVPAVQPSAIPNRLTGSYEAGMQTGRVFEGSPPAQQAVRDYLVSDLGNVTRQDGQIATQDVTRFMRQFAPALRGLTESGLITQQQADTLQMVIDDVNRHGQAMSLGRGSGSPTYQHATGSAAINEATGGLTSRAFGDNMGLAGRFVRPAVQPQLDDVNRRIADILMDPELLQAAAGRQIANVWERFTALLRNKLGVTAGVAGATTLQGQEQ